jgi:lipopolysaccharide export system protein LptC
VTAARQSRIAGALAALRHPGTRRTLVAALVLAVVAGTTQWLLWLEREPEDGDGYVGPPRSDYELGPFTLTALGEDGKPRFTMAAPRLTRHPHLGTFDIDAPRIELAGDERGQWDVSATRAWVDADSRLLRLSVDVRAARTLPDGSRDVRIATDSLAADMADNTLATADPVVIEQPGSILRGRGLAADLDTDVYVLEHEVSARYDKSLP